MTDLRRERGVDSRLRRLPKRSALFFLLAVLAVGTTGCDDPFEIRWSESPDTALIYSLSRSEMNLPNGFDFVGESPVIIEFASSTGSWDVALDTQDGELVFVPPGALGVASAAQLAEFPNTLWEEITEAPADSAAYYADRPLPVRSGSIYVFQTRQSHDVWGFACLYYGKIQPLDIKVAEGSLLFKFDKSPVCNDRNLIPNEN